MPVSPLDLAVLAIVLISAFLASVRGFTREVLAIISWVAAAVVAYFDQAYWHVAQRYANQYISNPTIAKIAAIAAVFLVTLIIVALITVKISDFILDSRVGPLDRSLGFLFGAARGALIALVAFAFFVWLVPDKNQPAWVKDSRIRPFLAPAADGLRTLVECDNDNSALKGVCDAMMKALGKGDKVDAADASGATAPTAPADPEAAKPAGTKP
jgi:membrane protein required for colicin V production